MSRRQVNRDHPGSDNSTHSYGCSSLCIGLQEFRGKNKQLSIVVLFFKSVNIINCLSQMSKEANRKTDK